MNPRSRSTVLAVALTAGLALSACVKNSEPGADAIAVTSSSDACEVSTAKADSGTISFDVTNDGDKITEFYLLDSDQLRIIGEVENIAPGTSRTLTIQAQPGDYFTECKPGMVGEGIGNAKFTVAGEDVKVSQDEKEAIDAAVASYTAYTKDQVAELVTNVDTFVAAYTKGEDEKARELFPITRLNYERIEPTAEQFGDLDPRVDYRKPGAEAENLEFTGFHRIEMDLWLDEARKNYPDEKLTALDPAGRTKMGDLLKADIKALYDKVHSDDFVLTIGDITNGAIALLDEVAAPDGKLTGEEDEFSHTDLYDFYANVEGAKVAFASVRDIARSKEAGGEKLVTELDRQFAAMFALLGTYGDIEKGFVSYDTVTPPQRNELGAQLNALSEPLSQLTHTVLGVSKS